MRTLVCITFMNLFMRWYKQHRKRVQNSWVWFWRKGEEAMSIKAATATYDYPSSPDAPPRPPSSPSLSVQCKPYSFMNYRSWVLSHENYCCRRKLACTLNRQKLFSDAEPLVPRNTCAASLHSELRQCRWNCSVCLCLSHMKPYLPQNSKHKGEK